jgi:ADP-ribose pyrophosphatase YjhB (NUDIX family)
MIRKAVQALIWDPAADRFLLIRKGHWTLVKGGVEEGEELEEAVRREIAEETGLTRIRVGPLIYSYQHIARNRTKHHIRVFLVGANMFEEEPLLGWDHSPWGLRRIKGYYWAPQKQAFYMLRGHEREAFKRFIRLKHRLVPSLTPPHITPHIITPTLWYYPSLSYDVFSRVRQTCIRPTHKTNFIRRISITETLTERSDKCSRPYCKH